MEHLHMKTARPLLEICGKGFSQVFNRDTDISYESRVVAGLSDDAILFLSRPYIAGFSMDALMERVVKNLDDGLLSTVDSLGESFVWNSSSLSDKENLEIGVMRSIDNYRTLSRKIKILMDERSFSPLSTLAPSVSMKPSNFCIISDSEGICSVLDDPSHNPSVFSSKSSHDILYFLCSYANSLGINVTIDMEERHWTDFTVSTYIDLLKNGGLDNVGVVLQTRLNRTHSDLARIVSELGGRARIRLCIGVYPETVDSLLPHEKPAMKKRLLEYGEKLLESGAYVEFATHDVPTINSFLDVVVKRNEVSPDRFEIQMLSGVPRSAFQKSLVDKGVNVRLYTPYAESREQALSYCRRRLQNSDMHVGLGILPILARSFYLGLCDGNREG